MKPLNTRQIALQILFEVFESRHSLDQAFIRHTSQLTDGQAWLKALCFGILRTTSLLDSLIEQFSKKKLTKKDIKLKIIFYIGLYQLLFMETKAHAAIFETVELAKKNQLQYASGFVNALLQNVARQGKKLLEELPATAHYNHPAWLLELIKKAYPQTWQQIIEENNAHPPLFIRVNHLKTDRADYLESLKKLEAPILTPKVCGTDCAIEILPPVDIKLLPGFQDGEFSVQDIAAQQAAALLELRAGQVVLDACAAPGGKTGHILETAPVKLYAVDQDPLRMKRVEENLTRLGLHAEIEVSDALDLRFKPNTFDRILLDAPCSGTGVIRRHPDIRFLRQPDDIPTLSQMQLKLLKHLWPILKPEGIFLYATCSILPQENDMVIQAFLAETQDVKLVTLQLEFGQATPYGWQLLPTTHGPDGFYYSKLTKT